MHKILALDPATKTGWCIGAVGERPTLGMTNLGRDLDDHFDVFARASRWIDLQIGPSAIMEPPDVLAIERPIPPSQQFGRTNFDTSAIALGLFAIFTAAARGRGIKILPAHIGSWRKYALGRGDLNGADAKRGMVRLVKGLGWGDVEHNAAEAAGMFLWASGQINPRIATRPEPLFVGTSGVSEPNPYKTGTPRWDAFNRGANGR
jgi:hypothetical protein